MTTDMRSAAECIAGKVRRVTALCLCVSACPSTLCCSSLLLQQLQTVLSVVRRSVAGVNGRAVLREEHQVLQGKQEHKHTEERAYGITAAKDLSITEAEQILSDPIADSGDDGVEVLDFAFQQHHPGALLAVGDWMVEQHIEEVAELGCDAAVLQEGRGGSKFMEVTLAPFGKGQRVSQPPTV